MRPKSSSLSSTQLAVFGGGGMLPRTPRTHPHRQTWRWKHYALGCFSAEGTGYLPRIKGTMDGDMYRQGQGSEMGRGGVFQHDNDPNTRPRQQRSVSRRSTLKSRSGRASLIENLWRELKIRVAKHSFETLMTRRGSAKRSGTKSLLRSVQTCWPTTRNL